MAANLTHGPAQHRFIQTVGAGREGRWIEVEFDLYEIRDVTAELVRAARKDGRIQDSLSREYRFTHRATESSDFLEGVRAQIIDKDRNPNWSAPADPEAVAAMLADLGPQDLTWEN